ncbi:ENTH-domain-containing protein [Rhizopus microsporus ATCC 52813]|uniref:ENTH-domain-containing protein n=1 Tax=Rhizopus microsporus ATCC 52813 TaxID=1340429 RepID=A0A2G4T7B7_RHIZD|nr:ENTH-domain-containing protein [Rhizopus microsporus ATCC 52813]PHZ16881.1 ENTH-domain-containing protein [Rhizopus microsporus ATCC 52813]
MNTFSNFQIPDVWEVKDVINKVKNVVLNYTEMEAKVHEATNNEPWGASTTLLQEIAQGTHNYQYFNEIMPTIYKRFTEKEPKQWRQIYKALVLLDYLIKNGSERVVDDARSHVAMIKIMRNFYYIDEKGKDEGLNVRNRAKEIVELLADTDRIREERKLARKNRNKYIGVGSDTASTRYVGFGSGSRGISFNGDAMSFGEQTPYSPPKMGKYDEEDDEFDSFASPSTTTSNNKSKQDKSSHEDDDDEWGEFTYGGVAEEEKTKASTTTNDDDFADFQFAVPERNNNNNTQQSSTGNDLFDLLGGDVSAPPTSIPQTTTVPPQQTIKQEKEIQGTSTPATGMWAQASNFVSLDSLGKKSDITLSAKAGPSMNSLKSTSVQASWNNWASNNGIQSTVNNNSNNQSKNTKSSPFDDLLS